MPELSVAEPTFSNMFNYISHIFHDLTRFPTLIVQTFACHRFLRLCFL